jgi:membrane protein YdbS with pleckstrin-like domain
MSATDIAGLIHPAIAVAVIFPLLGIVTNLAWQTRQRRLHAKAQGKSKIAPTVGPEHLRIGRWFSNGVVLLTLIGLAHPIFTKMASNQVWSQEPTRAWFVVLLFGLTIASLVLLNRAKPKLWRGVFATLTGMGLVVLGCQPEVFRRGFEWYVSHYYYGITAALLMVFSLAMFPDIYQDRSNRWRTVHIVLNCFALLLFVGQGFTGTRDLLEIPLGWQQPYIEQLYINNCQTQDCVVQPAPAESETSE